MKKLYSFLVAVIITTSLWAGSPEKIAYQAQVRNSTGQLITNKTVSMKIGILQTTTTGVVVYEEIQNPTTNANGLVTLEIGRGTVVSGTFESINWATGPYFIKTETDPDGGSEYTIIGTSQLLSVPYALYAKTAERLIGNGQHYVGELYGGGVVCWVDRTEKHGLVCSMVNIGTTNAWSNINTVLLGGTSDWDGVNNTSLILAQSGHASSAAKLCLDYINNDYGTGIFDDWYLPSKGEMNDLWNNLQLVQKTLVNDENEDTLPLPSSGTVTWFWTSTEYDIDAGSAYGFDFMIGYAVKKGKINPGLVRAFRAF